MHANVIVLAAPKGVERLTYEVPASMAGTLQPGHRVLVPLRSRKMTAVVLEVGERLAPAASALKPLLEMLEPSEPFLDRPHLELLAFVSSYYLVPLAEAYRAVVPGPMRVESRAQLKLARAPAALELVTFTAAERALIDALGSHPMTARQMAAVAPPREVSAALSALVGRGLVERHDGLRGRHRERGTTVVRLRPGVGPESGRGARQRRVLSFLAEAGDAAAVTSAELEARIPGARTALRALASRALVEVSPQSPEPEAADGTDVGALELNPEQSTAVNAIAPALDAARFETFLLFGVTGSGKTEVYLRLAARCLERGRRILILVPEIALADQLVASFRKRFGPTVGLAHSGQNDAERWAAWNAALRGESRILIGPRSALFAPLHDLGLIVVDEEHDSAYKQEEGVRYHARDLAVALGRFSRCPVVLGSATPSAESYGNARAGRYRMVELPRRTGERALAEVEVIDLRQAFVTGGRGHSRGPEPPSKGEAHASSAPPLSPSMVEALRANLAAGGQSLVFINRRGYHNFLQCRLCGSVISCPNCSVSMTFHLRDSSLRCHYCGHRTSAPESCPECRGFGLEGEGFGTERLAAALKDTLPGARIERMDSDTSRRKGARGQILGALRRGELDVLVGTQMITKGFDFPGVTLVAVVLADQALNMPDFRSAERTFQLLTQVAGRAGRGERPGRVLIQTYRPYHYSISAARDQDYGRFMRRELRLRRELQYPPYARLALWRVEGADRVAVEEFAVQTAAALGRVPRVEAVRVLGPAPAPIERIRNRFRWQVMVKAATRAELRRVLEAARQELAPLAERRQVRLVLDIDPVNML